MTDNRRTKSPAHAEHTASPGNAAQSGSVAPPVRTDPPPHHTFRSRVPRWLRVLLPAALILVWLTAASIGGPYFGKVGEASTNDPTTYLPESADATRVQKALGGFSDSNVIPAVAVFVAKEQPTDAQIESLKAATLDLPKIKGVVDEVSPLIASENGLAFEVFIPINNEANLGDTTSAISSQLGQAAPPGVEVFVTGPAGFTADLVKAFSGIDGLLLAVALFAVFIILIVVYRSFLLPIAVLSTSFFALTVALLVVWWLAKDGVLLLSGQTQGILFILVIGAATDYSLLYVSRYREELRVQQDKWAASMRALRGAFEPILASGGTVIAGLMCLLLSDLKSNSTLGPIASIGIIFAMLSALTLLPAILFAFGRVAFWPRRPKYEPSVVAAEGGVPSKGLWAWTGKLIRRHSRVVWVVATLVLLVGATGVTQLRAHGIAESDLVLGASEARDGQQALAEHFPSGSGSPVYVLVPENRMQDAANVLLGNPGLSDVAVLSHDTVAGAVPVGADGITAFGPPGTPAPKPTVSDGSVMLQATLTNASESDAAQKTVRDLRKKFAGDNTGALVGGVTATDIDTNDASIRDRTLIIPVVLVVILVILMLLLRSILAPALLVLTTLLSFGTALGVSALVFNGIFHFPGADPAVPLYGFVFLVALGIDYNIFLSTRVREESRRHGTREGIIRGLSATGGVITSAGLVLASTFAALSVIPVLFLVQIAFIVAFGVLIDTFLVRALLVPSLLYDIGPAVWWPSKLARVKEGR
ncbi:MMPL family transporter [Lysinibacter sp. HNR]|uniref:MMPL family transporter n=1 Tax=Lysinibacter sp. HNR TaxID=3031408 RepID=UPI00243572A6|nr:MMPL family transporter [Lysinibacter sp. HNR]WGD37800.1 MMPL family transporter [Lysinibacter sp. HNR]